MRFVVWRPQKKEAISLLLQSEMCNDKTLCIASIFEENTILFHWILFFATKKQRIFGRCTKAASREVTKQYGLSPMQNGVSGFSTLPFDMTVSSNRVCPESRAMWMLLNWPVRFPFCCAVPDSPAKRHKSIKTSFSVITFSGHVANMGSGSDKVNCRWQEREGMASCSRAAELYILLKTPTVTYETINVFGTKLMSPNEINGCLNVSRRA